MYCSLKGVYIEPFNKHCRMTAKIVNEKYRITYRIVQGVTSTIKWGISIFWPTLQHYTCCFTEYRTIYIHYGIWNAQDKIQWYILDTQIENRVEMYLRARRERPWSEACWSFLVCPGATMCAFPEVRTPWVFFLCKCTQHPSDTHI